MFAEDDLLPISALQHLMFCARQCALIHVEQLWAENRLTAEGGILHERVHAQGHEFREGVRVRFGLPLRSLRLGLVGQADTVEFHPLSAAGEPAAGAVRVEWQPFPVEYKRGKPRPERADEVQLCAQGMCLEEMIGQPVPGGALFYGRTRRRKAVSFDAELRETTEAAATRLHALVASGRTPEPVYALRCQNCSLLDLCLPRSTGRKRSVVGYLKEVLAVR